MVDGFVGDLEKDREIRLQKAGYRRLRPLDPIHSGLVVDSRISGALGSRGVERFYSHQAEAIGLIREGRNIVLMTPTASGKSLVYNVPVLEAILSDPAAAALYLFPLKGLEQDQVRNLNDLSSAIGAGPIGAVYDGDTPVADRKRIRESMPNVIFTNPDMLHLAFLPFHRKWADLFERLRYVVIDEIHSYRGVFGTQAAHVFRRLRRICEHYGARPQFITASATIANPGELAQELTGLPFSVVDRSGAPAAGRHFYLLDPVESPYTMAARLFVRSMRAGLRTIVFTKARRITELISLWASEYAPELKGKISPYRAGFLPHERREIERRLFSGELLGAVSTSALELGVDIGGLDCCILCGYPGSVSSTWQRAGRVGRQGRESAVFLIAMDDALDRFFMRNPDVFFERGHEAAVVDPWNRTILKRHLLCAAAELPLGDDEVYQGTPVAEAVRELSKEGRLVDTGKGRLKAAEWKTVHREVSLRAIGERYRLETPSGRTIGEVTGDRAMREAFPGAIYLHHGRQYRVEELDLANRKARCAPVTVNYYTQPLSTERTEILATEEERQVASIALSWGRLRITGRVTGFDMKRSSDKKWLAAYDLDLPERSFETEGLWILLDRQTAGLIEGRGFDLAGTLHAVEHAAIATIPLFALCDRGDVGGVSYPLYPAAGVAAIFIYDGHEGGVGLSKRAMEVAEEWLAATRRIIAECPCTTGCPSCVQDSRCGNRNEPLDKEGALLLLGRWLGL